jgi:hypothetical protein
MGRKTAGKENGQTQSEVCPFRLPYALQSLNNSRGPTSARAAEHPRRRARPSVSRIRSAQPFFLLHQAFLLFEALVLTPFQLLFLLQTLALATSRAVP